MMNSQINSNSDDNNEQDENIIGSEHNTENNNTEGIGKYDGYVFAKPTKKHKYKKRMSKGKKAVLIALISVLSVVVLVASTVITLNIVGRNALLQNTDTQIKEPEISEVEVEKNLRTVTYKGVKYTPNDNITTILAMGIDKQNLDESVSGTGGQADMILAIAHDTKTGKTTAINIPRDTIAEIDLYDTSGNFAGTDKTQLCLAYAYGDGREKSCENVKKSVSNLLFGTQINSYFALDLAAVPVLNDAVDGIQLTCLETVGPFTEGENLWLWGDDATTYVKTRNMNIVNANLLRNNRQKQYLEAFVKKVVERTKEDISTPLNMFNLMSDYMVTDFDASKITFLATNALTNGFSNIEFVNVPGEMKRAGQYAEYHHNEEELFQIFLDIYFNTNS